LQRAVADVAECDGLRGTCGALRAEIQDARWKARNRRVGMPRQSDGLGTQRVAVINGQRTRLDTWSPKRGTEGNANRTIRARGKAVTAIVGLREVSAGANAGDGERIRPNVEERDGPRRTCRPHQLVSEIQLRGQHKHLGYKAAQADALRAAGHIVGDGQGGALRAACSRREGYINRAARSGSQSRWQGTAGIGFGEVGAICTRQRHACQREWRIAVAGDRDRLRRARRTFTLGGENKGRRRYKDIRSDHDLGDEGVAVPARSGLLRKVSGEVRRARLAGNVGAAVGIDRDARAGIRVAAAEVGRVYQRGACRV